MKRTIVIIFLLTVFTACERKWTEKDKAAFVSGCLNGGVIKDIGENRGKSYCTCMLEKIMAKYPNKNNARFIRYDSTITVLGKECLKQP